jgi:hypothetical protein
MQLDARDGLVRLVDDALFRAEIVDQVAADDGDGAVREPNRNLCQVICRSKGRYLR